MNRKLIEILIDVATGLGLLPRPIPVPVPVKGSDRK
ncbi:MAG: PA1414 family protein [Candidatus Zixiibacteriota bacterium]